MWFFFLLLLWVLSFLDSWILKLYCWYMHISYCMNLTVTVSFCTVMFGFQSTITIWLLLSRHLFFILIFCHFYINCDLLCINLSLLITYLKTFLHVYFKILILNYHCEPSNDIIPLHVECKNLTTYSIYFIPFILSFIVSFLFNLIVHMW